MTRRWERQPEECTVEGCDRKPIARGWCWTHYRRWRAYGDPLEGRRLNGTGTNDEYRKISLLGEHVYEHRVVAGLAAIEGLEVHHKNGDKHDNRIENLELLTPSEHARLHKGTGS